MLLAKNKRREPHPTILKAFRMKKIIRRKIQAISPMEGKNQ